MSTAFQELCMAHASCFRNEAETECCTWWWCLKKDWFQSEWGMAPPGYVPPALDVIRKRGQLVEIKGGRDTWWLVLCWPGESPTRSELLPTDNLSFSLSFLLLSPTVLIRPRNFLSSLPFGNSGFLLFSSWCHVFSASHTHCSHLLLLLNTDPIPHLPSTLSSCPECLSFKHLQCLTEARLPA